MLDMKREYNNGGNINKIIIFRKPPAMPVRLEKAMPCGA
jgi:hypothetical protein